MQRFFLQRIVRDDLSCDDLSMRRIVRNDLSTTICPVTICSATNCTIAYCCCTIAYCCCTIITVRVYHNDDLYIAYHPRIMEDRGYSYEGPLDQVVVSRVI